MRGVLKVVAFDSSPFKQFSVRFSTKSVLAPFCGKPKTTQQTPFMLYVCVYPAPYIIYLLAVCFNMGSIYSSG
jgi:hypothetical protein